MRKNQMYLATSTDSLEEVVDFADTLKELCQRLGLSYENCKHNINGIFRLKNNPDFSHIFIKKVDLGDDE